MKTYDLYLTPLSPLHLGTDEDYRPTDYVMDEYGLHVFDTAAAMQAMSAAQRQRLERIVSGKPNPEMVKAIQKFFGNLHEPLRGLSSHTVEVVPGVLQQYNERLGRAANRETGGRSVTNQLEIERTAYNPVSQQALIPGSGIKGAIRTALLNHRNGGNPLSRDLRNDRQGNRKLQQQLFEYKNMHQDPLRLLKLQDAIPNPQYPELASRKVYFAVNRRRSASKQGQDRRNSKQGPAQRLESQMPQAPRAFHGSMTVISMDQYRDDRRNRDLVPGFEFSATEVARHCNTFYRPLLEEELNSMERAGYLDPQWKQEIGELLDQLEEPFRKEHAFLIRLGRHSGAESVTVNGVREIRIMQGPGKKPRTASHGTTWWMAAEQEDATTGLLPFGWAIIELCEQGVSPVDGKAIARQREHLSRHIREFLDRVESMRSEARQMIEQQQEKEEAQRRQQLEEAAREEERVAHRQTLSEQQLQVEDLREAFEQAVANGTFTAQGEVAQHRAELLKSAQVWESPEDRQAAHKLLSEMVKVLPWSKKKKKEYQQLMAELSSGS